MATIKFASVVAHLSTSQQSPEGGDYYNIVTLEKDYHYPGERCMVGDQVDPWEELLKIHGR